ncbi:sulfurtransferase [Tenacibaculum bernardetii]|uniref:sulfurtransferase n=1 Tax=Tenacibaculum bernardetii TaxID=3021375 RepID=UPI0023AFB886|nr:sulfurtransferase [Tenacibaculum bernardetii]
MKITIPSPLVSVHWLFKNIKADNLIILDASIAKVGTQENKVDSKEQIINSVLFDLKSVFLNKEGEFPNTIPTKEHFEKEIQKLGVNKDSCIIIYDDLGVYSSPRAWWLFKLFGFENVAVLNGGLPAWQEAEFPIETYKNKQLLKGNFKAYFKINYLSTTKDVLIASKNKKHIFDARSKGRFEASLPEPRKSLRGGHIPNSKSLPHSELQIDGKMKSKEKLQEIFSVLKPKKEAVIFSCGSGITACILALGNELAGNTNYSVYDGSWTEWASTLTLPVEK